MPDLAALREEYQKATLDESGVAPDPIDQFRVWFDQAASAGIREPNAMTLATASATGVPSARIVLLKGLDERGFTFFTNYSSAKGADLRDNPHAALVFFWNELERQVRIQGVVEKVTRRESEEYFLSRPPNSRLGAWVSPQSTAIPNRQWLEERMKEMEGKELECPPEWGGYRLRPTALEFWQGRRSRLHDRVRYRLIEGAWRIDRLAP